MPQRWRELWSVWEFHHIKHVKALHHVINGDFYGDDCINGFISLTYNWYRIKFG